MYNECKAYVKVLIFIYPFLTLTVPRRLRDNLHHAPCLGHIINLAVQAIQVLVVWMMKPLRMEIFMLMTMKMRWL